MLKESFGGLLEQTKDLESEIEELRTLLDRRELLQQHHSELFEKSYAIESKYPIGVKFDEQRRYRSDRTFLSLDDREEFLVLQEGLASVVEESNELDREILKKRFELGLKYLAEINRQSDTVWQEVYVRNPHFEEPLALYSKQWRAEMGDNTAEVNMTGSKVTSFFEGMKHVAEEIGDNQLLENLKKLPKERELDYSEIRLSFSVSPKTISREEKAKLSPGLYLSKRFDYYDELRDVVEVNLPIGHGAYAFPKIDENEKEKAKNEMISLAKKLGVKSF